MAKILASTGSAYSVGGATSAGLLIDARDYFREFYRAALSAQRSILISGWQFDRNVALLRGKDAEGAPLPVTLLEFLNALCAQKPELRIWILAWDFHLVFAAEREWMQRLAFHWMTSKRMHFRFDDNHVERGCHHQKFAVIDGEHVFVGGLDLCDHRWDDRQHRLHNPLRISRGEKHQPFHDIQAYLQSRELGAALSELFSVRWERAGGRAPPADALAPLITPHPFRARCTLDLPARELTLSRTDPMGSPKGPTPCFEIRDQLVTAILSAEKLIYVETQYFSSHLIAKTLEERMRSAARPKLEIVMILNRRGETLKEQAAVGLAQAQILGQLRDVAEQTGHHLGLYYTLPAHDDGDPRAEKPTFIHSKLTIIDDLFLCVGSANLTNRSMAIDTELNVSMEAKGAGDPLARAIRHVRASLLEEHTGHPALHLIDGLVPALNSLAERDAGNSRLRQHPGLSIEERAALLMIDPQQLPFDPDESDLPSEARR